MNCKALRVLFGVALMLGVISAQSASASPLTVGQSSAWITGDQDGGFHSLSTASGSVSCLTATFTAKTSGTTVNELTITPAYESCTAFGFANAHISMNGCTYTLTTANDFGTNQVIWNGGLFGQFHIACPEGKTIVITPTSFGVSVCTQTIGPQDPGGNIVGRSAGTSSAMDITLEISWTRLSYKGTGGACGTSGEFGTYTGKSTFRCFGNEFHTFQTPCTFS